MIQKCGGVKSKTLLPLQIIPSMNNRLKYGIAFYCLMLLCNTAIMDWLLNLEIKHSVNQNALLKNLMLQWYVLTLKFIKLSNFYQKEICYLCYIEKLRQELPKAYVSGVHGESSLFILQNQIYFAYTLYISNGPCFCALSLNASK